MSMLAHKVATVPGASSGIGGATALHFAAEGAADGFNARSEIPLSAVVEGIGAQAVGPKPTRVMWHYRKPMTLSSQRK